MFSTANQFRQVAYTYDPRLETLRLSMHPTPRPCFDSLLGGEISAVEDQLATTSGLIEHEGAVHRVRFMLVESAIANVFSFGGDLNFFADCVTAGNDGRERLLAYGMLCVNGVYRRMSRFGCGITTISVVAGEALGGGFEGAIASQLVVAERQARFGFPEVRFGLFPGMGARQLVTMRAGAGVAERLISTGETCTADQIGPQGLRIIDHVVPPGEGHARALELIRQLRRTGADYVGMTVADATVVGGEQERRVHAELFRADLVATVERWVDAAMALDSDSVDHMRRLVARQDRLMTRIGAARSGRASLRATEVA